MIGSNQEPRIKVCKLPPLLRFHCCYQPLVGTSELSGTVINFCPRSSGPDPPPSPFTPPPRQPPSPLSVQGSSPWVSLASGGPGRAVQGRCADGVKCRRVAQ